MEIDGHSSTEFPPPANDALIDAVREDLLACPDSDAPLHTYLLRSLIARIDELRSVPSTPDDFGPRVAPDRFEFHHECKPDLADAAFLDECAMRAMAGLLANSANDERWSGGSLAGLAHEYATAMLAERKRRRG